MIVNFDFSNARGAAGMRTYLKVKYLLLALAIVWGSSCNKEKYTKEQNPTLFELKSEAHTNIDFVNQLEYTEELNPYIFRNFYNGGGVGLGDINNDGFLDIFFSGNLVANKLYLNKGNFQFEDISEKAGIGSHGVWTTGVSIADVNGDGLLDIYICKSGPPGGERRHNELFLNNGDLTFTERAHEYGLADEGLSTHAAFFDFDRDGDLDCYLLNNSLRSVGGYDLRKDQRNIPDPEGGNKLYRNDAGRYVDVSAEAGIYTSAIGFGLGVTIGDVDKDGWQDIYVSNDFFEKDYLYINNRDGTFTESLENFMGEISMGSMGADMADINNDGLPEVFVTEMLPEGDDRLKTTAQFDKWDKYQLSLKQGYYHQFSRNTLQLNNGTGPDGQLTFSEISRMAGVHATDWSWGALIFDMDNDGLKDIFVANGIFKDLLDQDYVNFIAKPEVVRSILLQKNEVIKQLVDSIPSNRLPNYAFKNLGNLQFDKTTDIWGLGLPSHSNGSAYGDLDNDGDLDLVLNNVNMPASIYENKSESLLSEHTYLSISLAGAAFNTFALGSKVSVYSEGRQLYQELAPMRGFMSSVDYRLHFGLGPTEIVDSVVVNWPDGKLTKLVDVKTRQHLVLEYRDAKNPTTQTSAPTPTLLTAVPGLPGVDFVHKESEFVDFDRERLLFNMISNEGPCLCTGDVNRDGLEDFYVGGAKGQSGKLYIQARGGSFQAIGEAVFTEDATSEDTACEFFDANGDGLADLYVASGSNEFSPQSLALADRLYLNLGGSKFRKSEQILPVSSSFESTSVVRSADYDNDGDYDLFVGVRVKPFTYGLPGSGYILNNDGNGNFRDITLELAPTLLNAGLITDALWADLDYDGKIDLVISGEWMPIRFFFNRDGQFAEHVGNNGFEHSSGWIQALHAADFNQDGLLDLVTGNHGYNSRFKASVNEPVSLYINDFDRNGTVEQILTRFDGGRELPLVLRTDLLMQIPSLKKKYLLFENYKGQTISDIFDNPQFEKSLVLRAYDFSTSLWLNNGDGTFKQARLPNAAQFSPVYAIYSEDFDGDGHRDIVLGGNQYRAKPETGIYAASYGLLLKGDGKGNFDALPASQSGVSIAGEIRDIKKIIVGEKRYLLFGRNNERIEVLSY